MATPHADHLAQSLTAATPFRVRMRGRSLGILRMALVRRTGDRTFHTETLRLVRYIHAPCCHCCTETGDGDRRRRGLPPCACHTRGLHEQTRRTQPVAQVSLTASGRPEVARAAGEGNLTVARESSDLPVSLATVRSPLLVALTASGCPEVAREGSKLPVSLSTLQHSWKSSRCL